MPTQKDIEEFIEICRKQFGQELSYTDAQIILKRFAILIKDMWKMPPAPREMPKPRQSCPPLGFMGFWTGE